MILASPAAFCLSSPVAAMSRRKQILATLLAVAVCVAFGNFLWGEVKLQNQMQDLDRFCATLKIQSSLGEVQTATAIRPGLHMILLDQTSEGNQVGSIYFDGGRWGCSVTFMKGRLTKRSFGAGNLARNSGEPPPKLKSW